MNAVSAQISVNCTQTDINQKVIFERSDAAYRHDRGSLRFIQPLTLFKAVEDLWQQHIFHQNSILPRKQNSHIFLLTCSEDGAIEKHHLVRNHVNLDCPGH